MKVKNLEFFHLQMILFAYSFATFLHQSLGVFFCPVPTTSSKFYYKPYTFQLWRPNDQIKLGRAHTDTDFGVRMHRESFNFHAFLSFPRKVSYHNNNTITLHFNP